MTESPRALQPSRASVASRRVALLAVVLAAALVACERGEPPAADRRDEAGTGTAVPLEPERGAAQFVEARTLELLEQRIPAALEQMGRKGTAEAQRLCELGRRRIDTAGDLPGLSPGFQDTATALRTLCSGKVTVAVLDEFLGRVQAATGDEKRENTCQSGTPVMAFVYDHRSDDPTVAARREAVFAACPSLGSEWEAVDKAVREGRPEPEPEPEGPIILPTTRPPAPAPEQQPPE